MLIAVVDDANSPGGGGPGKQAKRREAGRTEPCKPEAGGACALGCEVATGRRNIEHRRPGLPFDVCKYLRGV